MSDVGHSQDAETTGSKPQWADYSNARSNSSGQSRRPLPARRTRATLPHHPCPILAL